MSLNTENSSINSDNLIDEILLSISEIDKSHSAIENTLISSIVHSTSERQTTIEMQLQLENLSGQKIAFLQVLKMIKENKKGKSSLERVDLILEKMGLKNPNEIKKSNIMNPDDRKEHEKWCQSVFKEHDKIMEEKEKQEKIKKFIYEHSDEKLEDYINSDSQEPFLTVDEIKDLGII